MSRHGLVAMGIGVVLLIPLLIFVVFPLASGSTKLLTVMSGSMSPAMKLGDVAVINEVDPSELEVEDIIAYRSPNEGNVISHRIVEVIDDEGLSFRTKGDANENPDQYTVEASDVVGKVVFTIPYLGYIFHYAGKPIGFLLLIFVPAVLLIALEVRNIMRGRKEEGKSILLKVLLIQLMEDKLVQ